MIAGIMKKMFAVGLVFAFSGFSESGPLIPLNPAIQLPPGYSATIIGAVSSICTRYPYGGGTNSCATSGDPRFLYVGVGNMADHGGTIYGVTPNIATDGTGTPLPQQELFEMSSDGHFKTIANVSTNRSCTTIQSGVTGTSTSRSVYVAGYDLGATSLYLKIQDVNETHLILNPQSGFSAVCQSGILFTTGTNGALIPSEQDTISTTTTTIKIRVPGL